MSNIAGDADGAVPPDTGQAEPPCDCYGTRRGTQLGTGAGQPHFRPGPHGPVPVVNTDGSGPCCDDPQWPKCEDCPHYPPVDRLLGLMEEERPEDAPSLEEMGDPGAAEACQMAAFECGDADWWRYGPDWTLWAKDADGRWEEAEDVIEIEAEEVKGEERKDEE